MLSSSLPVRSPPLQVYNFRIKFDRSERHRFNLDAEISRVELKPNLVLQAHGGTSLKEDSTWVVTGKGYETEEEALEAGEKVMSALLLAGARVGVGFDVGTHALGSWITDHGREKLLKETGASQILNDPPGLQVYRALDGTRFVAFNAKGVVGKPFARFQEALSEALNSVRTATPKTLLAAELYNLAHFEATIRARFLTFIIAIEAFLDRSPRSEAAQDLVRTLQTEVAESALKEGDKQSLSSSLEGLLTDSIGRTGRRTCGALLKGHEYAGMRPDNFFQACYDARSELVHNGETDKPLRSWVGPLDNLVRDLLWAGLSDITR